MKYTLILGALWLIVGCTNISQDVQTSSIDIPMVQSPVFDTKPLENQDASTKVHDTPEAFVKSVLEMLKNNESLETVLAENWTLAYYSYDRCDGSVSGEIGDLTSEMVLNEIEIPVTQEKNGWAECENPKDITKVTFDSKTYLARWSGEDVDDSYDFSVEEGQTNCFLVQGYVEGLGLCVSESKPYKVTKLSYSSEDPG